MSSIFLRKFSLFNDHWSPKRIGELNGQQVIIAKVQGEFVFHKHDDEDELFMVMKGQLKLEDARDQTVVINPGEFYIVPKVWSTSQLQKRKPTCSCSNR